MSSVLVPLECVRVQFHQAEAWIHAKLTQGVPIQYSSGRIETVVTLKSNRHIAETTCGLHSYYTYYNKKKIQYCGQTLRHAKKMLRIKIVRFKNSIFSPNFMGCAKMLQMKVVIFKKLYKLYIRDFSIGIIVFLINIKNAIK